MSGCTVEPCTETKYAYFFDLKDSGDVFYFDNVVSYVRKIMADVEKLEFDPQLKAEILILFLNKMVPFY